MIAACALPLRWCAARSSSLRCARGRCCSTRKMHERCVESMEELGGGSYCRPSCPKRLVLNSGFVASRPAPLNDSLLTICEKIGHAFFHLPSTLGKYIPRLPVRRHSIIHPPRPYASSFATSYNSPRLNAVRAMTARFSVNDPLALDTTPSYSTSNSALHFVCHVFWDLHLSIRHVLIPAVLPRVQSTGAEGMLCCSCMQPGPASQCCDVQFWWWWCSTQSSMRHELAHYLQRSHHQMLNRLQIHADLRQEVAQPAVHMPDVRSCVICFRPNLVIPIMQLC